MRKALALTTFAMLLSGPAGSIDLTGTWIGQWKCKAYDGEKFKPSSGPGDVLTITQTANSLAIGGSGNPFSGVAISDSKKGDSKGEVAASNCTTDNVAENGGDEVARLKATIDRVKGKGKLKGDSIYIESNGTVVGSCKWSYKLDDLADPGAAPCVSLD